MTLPPFTEETATAPCEKCGRLNTNEPRKPKYVEGPKTIGDTVDRGYLAWPCPVCGFVLKTATKDAEEPHATD